MFDEKLEVPLSPPDSPRMSDEAAKLGEYQWQSQQANSFRSDAPVDDRSLVPRDTVLAQGEQQTQEFTRPSLRSHKSFPYSLGPSSRLPHGLGQPSSLNDLRYHYNAQDPQPSGSSDLQPATFGGSAPTSPVGRLTPKSRSPNASRDDVKSEDEDMDFDAGEQEDGGERPPMTAAELRAQKRKMKRFRLTHNQTRYLTSEFARQAHPDAAHRERLSREIPGLSPRQVQVWFQNQRAKLKRLTSDDRERIMRSRALPADFDMAQALHAPFGATGVATETPIPSPGTHVPFGDQINTIRPLTLETLRRVSDYDYRFQQYPGPTGIIPALGAFAFTPPQSATNTMSPASAASDVSSFGVFERPQDNSRRHPFGGPLGGSSSYGAHHPQMSRVNIHERLGRHHSESISSPLRSSLSYTGPSMHHAQLTQHSERSASYSEQGSYMPPERRPQPRSSTLPSGPYGLGFSYGAAPNYESSASGQSSSLGMPNSPTMSMRQQPYRRDSSQLAGPPIEAYPGYQNAIYNASPMQHYPTSTFPSSFAQPFPAQYQQQLSDQRHQAQQPQQHQSFTPVSSQTQEFGPLGSLTEHEARNEEGDNSDGGVPLPPSY